MSRPDVVIAGAGPAGSVLATLLAREGKRVLILDRATFPRPKACGESLNPGGVRALMGLGLGEGVERLGPARMKGWALQSPGGISVRADFGGPDLHAWGIPRASLDATLLRSARSAGAEVLEGVTVLGCREGGRGGRRPRLFARSASGTSIDLESSVVVGADGLRSRVSGSLGWRQPLRGRRKASLSFRVRGRREASDRGTLFLGEHSTLGIAPVSSNGLEWNVTLVSSPDRFGRVPGADRMAGDPSGLVQERMEAAGIRWLDGPEVTAGPWASGSFHRPTARTSGPGVLLVGDAAGYYEPLTGQGISRAIRGAALAAPAIAAALAEGRTNPEFQGYSRALEKMIRPTRMVQKTIEFVVSRPTLRDAALGALSFTSSTAGLLVRVIGDAVHSELQD
jgi:flavin-dependent dehydrogenase